MTTKQTHKEFLNRQGVWERIYTKQYYTYLQGVNNAIAKEIEKNGLVVDVVSFLNEDRLIAIFKRLYQRVTLSEAKIEYESLLNIKKKDLIEDFINFFATLDDGSMPVQLWRTVLKDFVTVRISSRISYINETTRKHITDIIQKGLDEGLGALDVARLIRNDRQFNRNRALAIARTETVTAANQGKYMAALSSPYVTEKKWIPTLDARTRISHLQMQQVPWIPLTQNFNLVNAKGVLEEAQYPCAGTLSASNTVNCRCVIVTRAAKDENGKLIRKR